MEKKPLSEQSNAVAAMHSKKYRIAGDTVFRATAEMPNEQRNALRWLDSHARENNMGRDDLGKLLKKPDHTHYSFDSIYQALTGRRDGGLDQICQSIEEYRKFYERESSLTKSGFIETAVTDAVFRICRKALTRHRICFIFGESQVGKTTALMEYKARNNHGETIYVSMPTGGGITYFTEELAIQLGISPQTKERDLRRRIIGMFDERMLLIVDECHQCFRNSRSERSMFALEFIREIHEKRKCGVVLSGTNVFRDEIQTGKSAGMLRQLWLRGLSPLQLPDRPTLDQLERFAEAYRLDPPRAPTTDWPISFRSATGDLQKHTDCPMRIQTEVIDVSGLGRWIAILQEASDMATEKRVKLSWAHVIAAYALFKALEQI